VVEQWAIGLEQDDAFSVDPLLMQINPQQVLAMVSRTRTQRIQFKVLVLTKAGSATAEERAIDRGATEGNELAVYETRVLPRRIMEAALNGVAPRGLWPRLVRPQPGMNQFTDPTFNDRLREEQRLRWVAFVNRLFGTQFDTDRDAVVGWGAADV
jgi:hypothetical protein